MNNEHRQTTSVDVGVPTCTLSVCIAPRPCVRSDARALLQPSLLDVERRQPHDHRLDVDVDIQYVRKYIRLSPPAARLQIQSGERMPPGSSFPAPRPHLHVTSIIVCIIPQRHPPRPRPPRLRIPAPASRTRTGADHRYPSTLRFPACRPHPLAADPGRQAPKRRGETPRPKRA